MEDALRKLFSEEQILKYCDRIGVEYEKGNNTEEYLEKLIRAQLRTVPFDNATVWGELRTPTLETDALFEKIVDQKRGGYCFELNSLFYKFLKSIGYDIYIVIVYLRGNPDTVITEPAHCAMVVSLNGKKNFLDVGFGGSVPDGIVPFDTGRYGYTYVNKGVYSMVGTTNEEGQFVSTFCFKDAPCDIAELNPLNFNVSGKENSRFRTALMLSLRKDNGYCKVNNAEFAFKDGDREEKRTLKDKDELKVVAREYFGITDIPTRDFDWAPKA